MLSNHKTDGIGPNMEFKEILGLNGKNGLKMPDLSLLFYPYLMKNKKLWMPISIKL
jgi:hypothetical protein